MARGCSVCTLYGLNLALFLAGAALLAAPLVGCTEFCHLDVAEVESLRLVIVLQIIGGCLVVFSFLGCCLAASGKKRYRFPYLLVLLAAVVGGGLVVAFDQGLLVKPLKTFDPHAPETVDDAIHALASEGMDSFYHDFAGVYHAAECSVSHTGDVTCEDCAPLETAFQTCHEESVKSPDQDRYLKSCTEQFAKNEEDKCDGACTLAFCQCAGALASTVEDYAKYVKYVLLGVGALLFLLLAAGLCVSRKPEPVAEHLQGQVLLLQGMPHPQEPRRPQQPMLA